MSSGSAAQGSTLAPVLELRRVRKLYDGKLVVRDVELTVRPGETVALVGPSGCGKSTLLRLLVGLEQVDAGEVLVQGERLDAANLQRLRQGLGYVIQEGGLFPHLTTRDNVLLAARHFAMTPARQAQRLDELVQLTRFPSDALDRFPTQLSGGQRQRVSLMRALALEPKALLLDEPLGALDPLVRGELQDELARLFARLGVAVLLVTHDLVEAARLASRIVLLRDGAIEQEGTYPELARAPRTPFVRELLDTQLAALRALGLATPTEATAGAGRNA